MKHISHFTKLIINDIKTRYDKHRRATDEPCANTKHELQNRANARRN